MLGLEKSPNRNQILCFLLSFGLLITATMVLTTWNHGFMYVILAICTGLILTFGLILMEWRRKNSTLLIYNFWNYLADYYIRLLNYCLLALCLRLIFTIVGLGSSDRRFVSSKGDESMWQSRKTVERDYINLQYNHFYKRSTRSVNWIIDYINWSIASSNKWQIFLLPFLLLLSFHKTEDRNQSVSSNYTLY